MKDPAFLFYPGDYTGGTFAMSFQEKGAYVDLLILQFNKGDFSETDVKRILGAQFKKIWPAIKGKFFENNGRFLNKRLFLEMTKRKQHSEKQSANSRMRWDIPNSIPNSSQIDPKHHPKTIPLENRNENCIPESDWDLERGKFLNGGDWIFKFCNDKKIKLEEFDQKAKEFLSDLELKADYKPIKEIRRHFTNWYNKQKNGNQFKQDENGRSKAISAREKHDEEKLKKSGI